MTSAAGGCLIGLKPLGTMSILGVASTPKVRLILALGISIGGVCSSTEDTAHEFELKMASLNFCLVLCMKDFPRSPEEEEAELSDDFFSSFLGEVGL